MTRFDSRLPRFLATLLLSAATALVAGDSDAQTYDHLQCFKVKDPGNFSATVDLGPLADPPFPVQPGCRVKVRAKEYCVPVDATLVESDAPALPVVGQELLDDYLCYQVRCPRVDVPAQELSDRFGTREVERFKSRTLCVPALRGAPPTTTTTTLPVLQCGDSSEPQCDGSCGNVNFACLPADGGGCECVGVDIFAPCGLIAGAPECHGSCGGVTQGCVEDGGSGCVCAPVYE